jgi:4,5-dihydroxyphthalate decarboxylase
MTLKLKMTCGPYDRSRALIDGSVKPDGIELDITVNADDVSRQAQGVRGMFDVMEFFTGRYIADLPYRTLGFTAIPIFVKRMFRHSYIYVNKRSDIRAPADLNGKRVGVQTWFTSAALWARGMLADDHGVDLRSITWVADRAEAIEGWQPPSWLKIEYVRDGRTQYDLLAARDIDACLTTEMMAPGRHPDIDFLFPNYAELEREYFRRTKIFPIMHTLLIRNSILKEHPWAAMSLFKAWEESKQRCYEWLEWQRIHQTSLWYRSLWEEEQAVAGPDFYRWGFKKTRFEVEKMLEYAHSLGLTARRHTAEEMFWPSTLDT